MFRWIKRTASNAIRARGYTLSRPSAIEVLYTRNVWEDWFGKDVDVFASVYSANRFALSSVKQWCSVEALTNSLWRYGMPSEWTDEFAVNSEFGLDRIAAEPTMADMLAFLGRQMEAVEYLEIGVSVGKNLIQIMNSLPNANLSGLDVEEICPNLANHFDDIVLLWRLDEPYLVDSLTKGKQSKTASFAKLTKSGQDFYYLSADQFRDETWKIFGDRQFNLIHSDADHSPKALAAEIQNLLANNLVPDSGKFAMLWDDLWGEDMQRAFIDAGRVLCKRFDVSEDHLALIRLPVSYGPERPIGLFTSFKI